VEALVSTSVKRVEVLAFAYIRTGTTADRRTDQNRFEVFGKRGRRSRSSTYSQAFGGIDLPRCVVAEALMLPLLVVEA
jgi:hypothetical protein